MLWRNLKPRFLLFLKRNNDALKPKLSRLKLCFYIILISAYFFKIFYLTQFTTVKVNTAYTYIINYVILEVLMELEDHHEDGLSLFVCNIFEDI